MPDLVVYLQAPTDLLKRLLRERAKRDDDDAPLPSEDYLAELNEAYNHFFFHYTATPLLVVETSQVDLTLGRRGDRRPAAPDQGRWAAARGTTCRARRGS